MLKGSSADEQDLVLSTVGNAKLQFENFLVKHKDEYSGPLAIEKSSVDVSEFDCVLCTRWVEFQNGRSSQLDFFFFLVYCIDQ